MEKWSVDTYYCELNALMVYKQKQADELEKAYSGDKTPSRNNRKNVRTSSKQN